MNEKILQQLWKFQYFNKTDLKTDCGKKLHIYFQGNLNSNAGPDFMDARLQIENTEWAGNVEIHVLASDWFKHHHQHNPHYCNVVLHVVWINDIVDFKQSPILSLQNRVGPFEKPLMESVLSFDKMIPCSLLLKKKHFTVNIQFQLLKQRFERKSSQISILLQRSDYDWEQVCWIMLCRNFGYPVNEEAFEKIAITLPYKIIMQYHQDVVSLEALLFGVSGLLSQDFLDAYPNQLKSTFNRLKKFHSLETIGLKLNFLRMRPMNFPTIRLAQLSAFLHGNNRAISNLMSIENMNEVGLFFSNDINSYWKSHFLFDTLSPNKSKAVGESLMNNIIINTLIPLKISRFAKVDSYQACQVFISMLKQIKPESNHIINEYQKIGLEFNSAVETQASIELYKTYCSSQKCKDCMIAHEISKTNKF